MPSLLFSAFVPFFLTLLLLFLFILIPRSGGKSGSNKKTDGVKVTLCFFLPSLLVSFPSGSHSDHHVGGLLLLLLLIITVYIMDLIFIIADVVTDLVGIL